MLRIWKNLRYFYFAYCKDKLDLSLLLLMYEIIFVSIILCHFLITFMVNWNLYFILQMPPKLLIQVPRFGKQFKTYKRIIPDKILNLSKLVHTDEDGMIGVF